MEPCWIASAAAWLAEQPAWRDFVNQPTVSAGMYTDPDALEPRLNFAAGDRLLLARILQGDRVVAMIPLVDRKTRFTWRFGLARLPRVTVRMSQLADFGFAREPEVVAADAFEALLGALRHDPQRPDLLVVDSVPDAARTDDGRRRPFQVLGVQSTYIAELAGDFETYWRGLSSKQRLSVTTRVRRFEKRAANAWRLESFRTPAAMPELRIRLEAVYRASWHAAVGEGAPPASSYLTRLAGQGWVRSYILSVADRPVAAVLGFQYQGVFDYDTSAYVSDWREHTPGIVLLYHLLRDLHATDRPERLDFGFGFNEYKRTFGTREERRGMVRLGMTARGRAIDRIQAVLDAAFRGGKTVLGKTGIPQRIKARMQRKIA